MPEDLVVSFLPVRSKTFYSNESPHSGVFANSAIESSTYCYSKINISCLWVCIWWLIFTKIPVPDV